MTFMTDWLNPSTHPFFWLVVMLLATWRLTSLLQLEKIFAPLRTWIGIIDHDDPEKRIYPKTFIGALMSCFWCVSVWIGVIVYLIWMFFPLAAIPFALSAGAIGLQEIKYHAEKTRQRWAAQDDEHQRKTLADWIVSLSDSDVHRFYNLLTGPGYEARVVQEYISHHPSSKVLPAAVWDRLTEPGWYLVLKLLIQEECNHRKPEQTKITISRLTGDASIRPSDRL